MENKQKQIEEMARDLCNRYSETTERCRIDHYGCNYTCGYYDNAKTLYDKGYRKIPENAVVLTREEYKEILDREYELKRWALENGAKTAEKFAERLKSMAYQSTDWSHGEHPMVVEVDYIDEIAEEFTDGIKIKL